MSDVPLEGGRVQLFDRLQPALEDGTYRLSASVDIARQDGEGGGSFHKDRFFVIEGPRFSLPAGLVAGVYPPRNAEGPFDETLPLIALSRRTLPWERSLPDAPGVPWVALLVVDDKEDAQVLTQVPLASVLDPASLTPPSSTDPTCDALELPAAVLKEILPEFEELSLLCHVRRVSPEGREPNEADEYAVVVANRVPTRGRTCRACLVSLESVAGFVAPPGSGAHPTAIGRVRLPLLHSWSFTCEQSGTFRERMQALDVGRFGVTRDGTEVTFSGHVALPLIDRGGARAQARYHSPLVPLPTARDPRGPYHTADQARLVSVEDGTEDATYAAAFELGRLLAAADRTLAQSLTRFHGERLHTVNLAEIKRDLSKVLELDLDSDLLARLRMITYPMAAMGALGRIRGGVGPTVDPADAALARSAFDAAAMAANGADLAAFGASPEVAEPIELATLGDTARSLDELAESGELAELTALHDRSGSTP